VRRYAKAKPSRGTVIPAKVRLDVLLRDNGCVGRERLPGDCEGAIELDHVRASGGMGMKSPTTPDNLVSLCGSHHRFKTEHGREARPLLLAYLEGVSA
jgi:5-methylcytosine-specific restriction endonuclease McrA